MGIESDCFILAPAPEPTKFVAWRVPRRSGSGVPTLTDLYAFDSFRKPGASVALTRAMLKLLTQAFFRCPVCNSAPVAGSRPFCELCWSQLRRFKSEPNGDQNHDRYDDLDSLNAAFLMIGGGYEVLREWKKIGSRAADRNLLELHPVFKTAILKMANLQADGVIAIPQSAPRTWVLKRSPAHRVAQQLSKQCQIRLLTGLDQLSEHHPRQAVLNRDDRFRREERFAFNPWLAPKLWGRRVILVDDFTTTGQTLRQAARALKRAGALEVHGFCLGIRPRKQACSSTW